MGEQQDAIVRADLRFDRSGSVSDDAVEYTFRSGLPGPGLSPVCVVYRVCGRVCGCIPTLPVCVVYPVYGRVCGCMPTLPCQAHV